MAATLDELVKQVLTLPDPTAHALSLRATALIFADPKSQRLLNATERVAHSEATILITGETGTGKELVARHIHEKSRRSGPFIAVNCGALTESLADAELFGHEKGAFTGAMSARAGWFEAANGGTLFLDEVGDLPQSLQVKLLRVLQEREVVRLGSRRAIPIDVRLVAATNVDLEKAVASGHFRMDLYYRLNVVRLDLLPLRERQGDILPLAEHFAQLYGDRMHIGRVTLTDDAESALLAYGWPGNIRELENVMHYALLVCDNRRITADNLRLPGSQPFVRPPTPLPTSIFSEPAKAPPTSAREQLLHALQALYEQHPDQLYDTLEQTLIDSAYRFCDHNQVRTAELLGISRNVVRSLLQRHGMLPARLR